MKKFVALLISAVLIVSMAGIMTAFAGASISGNSEVLKGKSYKYTAKVSVTGLDMVAKIEGLGQSASMDKNSGGGANGSLSASASITVSIPSSAQVGDKYTITLTGQYSYYDDAGTLKAGKINESKTITVVAASTSTPKPATSSSSSHSQAPATPTPAPTGWALAAIDVAALAQGGEYDMDAPEDGVVPGAVLSSLKDKQGVLSVDFGSYSCIIDGASLGTIPEDFAGIDLGLTTEKDPALSTAAGGADVYQLHFKYEGALPGRFTFRFKAEQSSPGDTVYLYYYYDASGIIEGKQACAVDDEGYVSVEIYHCSDYFLSEKLLEGAAGIIAQPEPAPSVELQPTEAPAATPAVQAEESAKSNIGVSAMSPVEQWFGVPYAPLIAALAAAMLLSMLLTMLTTRSGLFKKRVRAGAGDCVIDVPETAADKTDDDMKDGIE